MVSVDLLKCLSLLRNAAVKHTVRVRVPPVPPLLPLLTLLALSAPLLSPRRIARALRCTLFPKH